MAFGLTGTFTRAANTSLMKQVDEKTKDALYKKLTMFNPSTGPSETLEWLGYLPGMSEWLGDRQIKGLRKKSYTITNKKWESTIGFKQDDLEDNPSIVKAQIPMLVDSVIEHPTNLLFKLIVDGETGVCYDGQPMFDNSHPYFDDDDVEQTFDNLLDGNGITVANIQTDFGLAVAAFQGYKKRNGDPVFATVDKVTIIHSPALNVLMKEAFVSDIIGTDTNVYAGQADLISSGYLTGNDWYALILTKAMKPFIFQLRKKVVSKWSIDEFMTENVLYGVDGRYNVGYGFPHFAIKIDN